MIQALVNKVAQSLVTLNSEWLTEIRTLGYLQRRPEGDIVTTDGLQDIGLTDREGNSGFIRFESDINFNVQEMSPSTRYSSCEPIGHRFSVDLRLVVVANTEVPQDLPFALSVQMASIRFTDEEFKNRNVAVRAISGGSHTMANVKTETGKETLNNENAVVFVKFRIYFDYKQNCEAINIPITMNRCEDDNYTDYGCYQLCEGVTLNQNATYTGDMVLHTYFNGISVDQTFEVVIGEPIVVPTENLNADYEFIIELFDNNGERVTIKSNAPTPDDYDSFKIKVTP